MMKISLLLSALLLSLASVAAADNFRCPNGEIVSTGDRQSIVAMKCDPPTYKNSRTESEAGYKGATILVSVEEWTYNEGPHRLVHILTFRNGLLDSVQTAGFGK
ncbi:Protein of unknown function [Trichlorobacter thiogenes]|uniref:DUF2845 domain-containing protein n=1 Tax=Trichlorobacter thiogenes TaxID=115783 RepID=A0A1T4JZ43_9BACT|nr:DUF2845 domain-containing protein [Trichlorobacter thiogenes]SJZ35460.1 Protein of unknown function [Trichlorobacter thiogenes]